MDLQSKDLEPGEVFVEWKYVQKELSALYYVGREDPCGPPIQSFTFHIVNNKPLNSYNCSLIPLKFGM